RGRRRRRARQAGPGTGAGREGDHAHADLPGGPPLRPVPTPDRASPEPLPTPAPTPGRRPRRVAVVLVFLAGVAVLGAASALLLRARPVRIDPPAAHGTAATVCASLHDQLPDVVGGADRRPTSPDSPYTAAWGATPILLRCGVGRPAALLPTSQLTTVAG